MRIIGVVELAAYLFLWSTSLERVGAYTLIAIMLGAVHMHMLQLGDSISDLMFPQLALLGMLVALLLIPSGSGGRAKSDEARKKGV